MWTAVTGIVGTIFNGIFGMKKQQGKAVEGALKIIGDVNSSEGEREKAIASVITTEMNRPGVLGGWRSFVSLCLFGILVSAWFGYIPPYMSDQMINNMFELFKICLLGYMPARTIDKMITKLSIGSVLKKYIEKKVL